MTNFSDFAVQEKDFEALQNFWRITNGIYIWEYVTTLDFELDIIRGRRSYGWTIWIYSLARAALLIGIILNLVDFNVTTPMNCQALITLQLVVANVSLVSASLLVIFRIIAIWDKNKYAVAIAVITWVINVSIIIRGVARLRATWDPTAQACVILNNEEIKPTFIISLITNTILLVTMLVGLFRLLISSSSAFGLGRLLWKQGVIWLLIATVAGVPPTVFIFLNLNAQFNLMFQLPAVIINTIAATRIHRSLVDYTFESSNISLDAGSSKSDTKVSKMISLNRTEIAVDIVYEQYPTSRTTLSMGTQQGDKPHGLSVGSDLPVECA
ncbi:hypothetical protein F5888DRAFT_1099229 [Russula emetica]|nr:hypothetical protein F5888DRAFT_1099229 [Russula emetica]